MFKNRKRMLVIMHDLFMTMVAWELAWLIRFNFEIPQVYFSLSLLLLPVILIIQGLTSSRFYLYRGIWRFASIPDLWNIFRSAAFGTIFITLALFISIRLENIPRSILVLYPILFIFLIGGPRLGYRAWKDNSINLRKLSANKRVLIIGCGSAGEMLARDILRESSYFPVGFIDDDESLANTEIQGIRVLGKTSQVSEIANKFQVEIIIIAVPSASREQMQKILAACEKTDCEIRTLPNLQDMVSGRVTINQLRNVLIEDLLGRDKVKMDWKLVQDAISNKVVMVTGGGGSIGTELCIQAARLNPKKLIIFERAEFNLYKIEQKLSEMNLSCEIKSVLGDLCEKTFVDKIVSESIPDIIFHTAAYKHVPILQKQPREAAKNNILATKNIAEAAIKYECSKFIYISTDKAVNPTNMLGMSKRISEIYCEWLDKKANTKFITVRFGNVLDSDGSVVPLFREQISRGGPVTVTHPEITRFFMTIPEACQLIMQASSMGNGGEIFVLDMGEPVKIKYLAEQMIRLSGREPGVDIEIVYSGLRPGEKLYEELFYDNENRDITEHPKILLARHPEIDWITFESRLNKLEDLVNSLNDLALRELIEEIVPPEKGNENIVSIKDARK